MTGTASQPSAAPASADRAPLAAALTCYTVWGLLPILFILAGRVGAGAFETVAWRTIWSLPCAAVLVVLAGQTKEVGRLSGRTLAALTVSSLLIVVNWSTYVWAVESGRTLSASLGYYLNPLLNMAVGALVFKERIGRAGGLAIALASVGVALQGLALGEFPWVSLVLAVSFCGYGLVRKTAAVSAQSGLLVECMILAGPAIAYAAWLRASGHGVYGHGAAATFWLTLGGPATAVPLALFAFAARRMPLTVIGFLQFIAPTLQFLVGVESGEPLTPTRQLAFAFIWLGVLVFALGGWRRSRAASRGNAAAVAASLAEL